MESKLKHLKMIQAVINRMAHNSFLLKGWSVILTAALFVLAANDAKPQFILVALFPALMLWGLDGYFLWQERLFRALYDRVRLADSSVDYSMNTEYRAVSQRDQGLVADDLVEDRAGFSWGGRGRGCDSRCFGWMIQQLSGKECRSG